VNRKQRRAAAKSSKQPAPARTDTRFGWFAEHMDQMRPYPATTDATCPDCGARFDHVAAKMVHQHGCPIAASYEAASADDKAWFREHPGETVRTRTPTMGELQQQMLMAGLELPDLNTDVHYEPGGEVVTHYLSDDCRVRNFSSAVLLVKLRAGGC